MRIGIVGAGIAGLVCARELSAAGHGVVVFDKGRAPGGRISTRRQAGLEFDHGAQYFTARAPAFEAEVRRWVAAGVAAPWPGRFGTLTSGAVEPTRTRQTRYVGSPAMSAPAGWLAASAEVHSGTRVERLEREGRGWRLVSDERRGLGVFDAALVTAPAPQATALLHEAPALVRAASGARLRPCWAVMLGFDQPLELPLDGAFVRDSPLSWLARNSSKPGRPGAEAWVLHAAPEWSEAHLELHPEEVVDRLLEAFSDAWQRPPPAPSFSTAHRWRFALPDPALEEPCLYDPDRRIGAAGDWCGGPRVEGAFLSGAALARRVLDAA